MSNRSWIRQAFSMRIRRLLNFSREAGRGKRWYAGLSPEERRKKYSKIDKKKINAYKKIYNSRPKAKFYIHCGCFLLSHTVLLKFAKDQNPELFPDVQDVNQNLLLFEEK